MSKEEILEGACLTLEQLCAAAALDRDWLVRHVEEGLIPASGAQVAEWRFAVVHVTRARRMHEIERAYEAVPELAALVADLLEEMDDLRARLGRGGGVTRGTIARLWRGSLNPSHRQRLTIVTLFDLGQSDPPAAWKEPQHSTRF